MSAYKDIRNDYIDFFKSKGHTEVASSSLIPAGDQTLLFTNAGMNQFKDVFAGIEKRLYKRATTCQKCVRAGGKHNDLDNVGYTNRHHTFFEMLGNFSFGDYFKEDAIAWAWEFVIKHLQLPKDKLYVTVYHTDEEAYNLWSKHIDSSRIVKISTDDNFWTMGDTGPCGPCSEIYYDFGENAKIRGGNLNGGVAESDRYMEIWNLVFTQFERFTDGHFEELKAKNIDTGAGLERLIAVAEGKTDTYETSLMQAIMNDVLQFDKNEYTAKTNDDVPLRVIADHLRAMTFLICDGVLPSNKDRGYVLRRIMRRAVRYGKKLNNDLFLSKLVGSVIREMGDFYPELITEKDRIVNAIDTEEKLFAKTLDDGLKILNKSITDGISNTGELAFKMYDTYGFPYDLTEQILRENNLECDVKGFEKCLQEQKDRSKKDRDSKENVAVVEVLKKIANNGNKTEKLFWKNELNCDAKVLSLIDNNGVENQESSGDCWVVLDKTTIYNGGGGQTADEGTIFGKKVDGFLVADGIIAYHVNAENSDAIKKGDVVKVESFRKQVKVNNHTATHLLQASLRKLFGDEISQKGSKVCDEYGRFDFSFSRGLTKEELAEVQNQVQTWIDSGYKVFKEEMLKDLAHEKFTDHLCAFFDEKYGEKVRVVWIEDENKNIVSAEFCGGTHVDNTKEIGEFIIEKESSVGSGVRRIKFITK